MTVYTTITDATLTSGKPGTQAVFRALRDNAIAITEKAAGAPVLANAYVTQAMLKTTTGELSTTTETIATLPGGEYGFWPQQRVNNAANYIYLLATAANVFNSPSLNSTTFTSRISFGMSVGTGGDASFVRQRYIQASPPYDLGDGEIPLFIFAIII